LEQTKKGGCGEEMKRSTVWWRNVISGSVQRKKTLLPTFTYNLESHSPQCTLNYIVKKGAKCRDKKHV
jgi:hypothetical protein